MLEPAALEAEAALVDRLGREPNNRIGLGRSVAVLGPDEAEEITGEIESLIREHFANRSEPDDPEAQTYAFTYTFLPTTPI